MIQNEASMMAASDRPEVTAFSNSIRLTGREWIGVGLFAILLIACTPALWKKADRFSLEPDYRMPHELSNDYWLYQRYAELAASYDTVLVGDSVIWGEYVTPQQTLSHYLNEFAGRERYANMGLDGAHPVALAGLVEYYATTLSGKSILLHCNPLWMTSPRTDLRDEKATEFNHPELVPQFDRSITSYKAEMSPRIGIAVERHVSFSSWTRHLQQAYFERTDIPTWTLEHPYKSPLRELSHGLPRPDNSLRHPAQPWFKSGITKQDYPWIPLKTSLQWQAFRRVVEVLQRRGNRLFVLVGPFNEHLLMSDSLQRYQRVKTEITDWLKAEQIPHFVPAPLPSEQYGDASHPLAAGYAQLARQIQPMLGGER